LRAGGSAGGAREKYPACTCKIKQMKWVYLLRGKEQAPSQAARGKYNGLSFIKGEIK